jgi:hypothetical protein
MFQSNLELPLNTKKVYHNLTELLPKVGNFWGHRFWVMNFWFTTPEITPSFYAYSFRVPAYTCTLCEWLLQRLFTWGPNDSVCSSKSCGKLKPLVVVCVCNLAYSRENLSLCTCSRLVLTFVTYSRCLPPYPWPLMHRRGLTWLPRGGWFSCTFVGHPKGLWVHSVSWVLDTWAHDHKPTASLGSEGEDPLVPDTSYLGRVGGKYRCFRPATYYGEYPK